MQHCINVRPVEKADKFKKSLLAFSIMALSVPTIAQEPSDNVVDENKVEEVVVYGIKASLQNAQALKRDGDTVKDVITASDIGALPDKSITEALQRVPGVTIGRFAAPTDPKHFASEGRGVLVRGLDKVHSQFNGRDSFSAGNWTSGLSYEDVPAELVGTVEVVKNQTADIIAGGIAGTVNLVTRKPLDFDGQKIYVSTKASYGDKVDDWAPSLSGLYSNRWETSSGEWGFLFAASTSEFTAAGDGISMTNFYERSATQTEYPDNGNTELPGFAGETLYMPTGPWMRTADSDRDRTAFDVSLQWRSDDERFEATAEFISTSSEENWRERVLLTTASSQGFTADYTNAIIAPGTEADAVFDSNGFFEAGTISYPWNIAYLTSSRGDRTLSEVEDTSINFVFTPSDEWRIVLDYQHLDSIYDRENNTINNRFAASDVYLDLRSEIPSFSFLGTNTHPAGTPPDWLGCPPGDNPGSTSLADPKGSCDYYQVSIMDTNVDAEGTMDAFTADVEWEIDRGWLKSAKGGVYFSSIDRTTQDDEYINWGAVSHTWGALPLSGLAEHPGLSEAFTFDSDYMGGDGLTGPNRTFLFPRMETTQEANLIAYEDYLADNGINNGGWVNRRNRAGTNSLGYLPHEVVTTKIDRQEAYIRIDLENEDLSVPIKANLGLRYVSYDTESIGTSRFNDPSMSTFAEDYFEANFPTEFAFFNGDASTVASDDPGAYTTILPSLNITFGITDDILARFAFSKAIFFPSLYDMRYTKVYTSNVVPTEDPGDPTNITDMTLAPSGTGGNPFLEPEESDQLDLTAEWYFSDVGSLTFSLFYKDIGNLVRDRTTTQSITNPSNGITLDVPVQVKVNEGNGTVQGFEFAYQQTYDFLPGPWSGLGMVFNYTYVDQEDLNDEQGDVQSIGGSASTFRNFTGLPLPLLSEETINLGVFWQYAGFEARTAYNWRSEYLVTRQDADFFAPVYAEPTGYLDASLWYSINDNLRVGIEGSNLLDTLTETNTQFNQAGKTTPANFFLTDRRYALSLRATF